MTVRLEDLLFGQAGVVGRWQMLAAGVSVDPVRHFAEHARYIGSGVYLTGHAPMTAEQRRWAAVLAAPDSYLGVASAGDAYGIRPWQGSYEIAVRPGSSGPKRFGDLLVCRSTTLRGDTTTLNGLPITTVERTIVDLGAHVRDRAAEKTMPRLQYQFHRSRGRRGIAGLRDYAERFGGLPFARCRSDAEAMGLQVLADAGRPIPQVNAIIAGEEADFSWPGRNLIIEIDGPQYHLFADEDARKTAAWQGAGQTVRRIASGAVFDQPHLLIALHDARTVV